MNRGIRAALARGGASRGLLVREEDLRGVPRAEWERLFAFWLGSPDPSGRQVDGAGGGNPSTSKVVVLGPSTSASREIDYTFFQVDPVTGRSECRGTCGNLTAAAGLFAVSDGLVEVTAPATVVRLRDTNTGRDIDVTVPLAAVPTTSRPVMGSPRTPAPPAITSTFLEPGGATTGSLLPTGKRHGTVELDGDEVEVTLVDAVNPVVLVDGTSLGADPHLSPAELEADVPLMRRLEHIRLWAAVQCRFASSTDAAVEESWYLPYIGMSFPAQDYTTSAGASIGKDDVDLVLRMLSGPTVHRALPLSAGLATAAAAVLDGAGSEGGRVRLGHPGGVLEVDVAETAGKIDAISVASTARIILRGYLDVE